MKDKNLKGYLQQSLGEEVQPKRLEETIKLCTEIVREQEVTRAEPRTGFFHYLSDVFRFDGIPIFAGSNVIYSLFNNCQHSRRAKEYTNFYAAVCIGYHTSNF